MDSDRIVEIGARALAEESTGVLWDQMTSGQKAAEIARSKREFRAVLAAFEKAGLVVEQGWQPIETAPGDGTEILVWGPDQDGTYFATWGEGWWIADECPEGWTELLSWPTHWRPLPAPPAAKADPQ